MIGTNILHYRILKKIGEGGMGVVYLAEDTKLKRQVAIKFLPHHISDNSDERKRFEIEAQAAAALNHPNISHIYAIEETDDEIFIVMEYIDGMELKEEVRSGKIKIKRAVDIAIQIAEGLQVAHEKGIVHRDTKSSNIMITDKGKVKIMDFGLAKVGAGMQLTKEQSTLGTAAYMSPEQAKGEEVDQRSDIWSFGVVLYEMLTGELPFKGDYEQAVIYSILNEKPQTPAKLKSDISPEFESIVFKCLEKQIQRRYQNMEEFILDFQNFQRKQVSPEFTDDNDHQLMRTQKRMILLITFLGVLILTVAGYFIFSPNDNEGASEKPMLVILPFKNLGLPEDEYIADGVIDEITARLSVVEGIGVIARTSAMAYKNSDKTVRAIGEELGVDYILEGTVRWQRSSVSHNQVRVTPKLIKVADETQLWAEVYQKDLVDIFRLQSNIAEQVVTSLEITLSQSERRAIASKPTENLLAYDFYLRGKEYFFNREENPDNLSSALHMYHKAIELDSKFALAYALESRVHANMYHFFYDRTAERLSKAKETAEQALAIRPDLPEAHLALGWYYYRNYEYDRALEELLQAQKLKPGNSLFFYELATVQRRSGLWSQALENYKKSFKLDPHSRGAILGLAHTHHYLRQHSEALTVLDQGLWMQPDSWFSISRAILHLSTTGNISKAHRELMQIEKITNSRVLSKNFSLDDYQSWWVIRNIGDYGNVVSLLTLKSFEDDTISYHLTKGELYGLLKNRS